MVQAHDTVAWTREMVVQWKEVGFKLYFEVADSLAVEYEKKREVEGDSKAFGLSVWAQSMFPWTRWLWMEVVEALF